MKYLNRIFSLMFIGVSIITYTQTVPEPTALIVFKSFRTSISIDTTSFTRTKARTDSVRNDTTIRVDYIYSFSIDTTGIDSIYIGIGTDTLASNILTRGYKLFPASLRSEDITMVGQHVRLKVLDQRNMLRYYAKVYLVNRSGVRSSIIYFRKS